MFEHKYIKFLDFVVRQKSSSFCLQKGFEESGLSKYEFSLMQDVFFYRDNLPDEYEPASEFLEWKLKPEALFGYLSFKQYEHAIHSAKWALWIATASLAAGIFGTAWGILT
jgi:hypothetical protein